MRYSLAPMDGLMLGSSLVVLSLPGLFSLAALKTGIWALLPIGLVLLLVYASVWLWWRPRGIQVSPGELVLDFPLRRRSTAREDILACRSLSWAEFQAEFGMSVRVGAGGLWGGFGWLWTRKRRWVEFYISRMSDLVLIERKQGPPLLLTPNDPAALVRSLGF